MQKTISTVLLALLTTAGASVAGSIDQERDSPQVSESSRCTDLSDHAVANATLNLAQETDSACRTASAARTDRAPQTTVARAPDVQDAPLLVEGLRLRVSPEDVSGWLLSMPGIESTRMNPPDEKGRASMQVIVVDPNQHPRIAGVRGQLWPIFVDRRLQGLRVLFMPEVATGAIFCTIDGRGAAQRLNAYLTDRFGEEKAGGFYEKGGLRARLIYRISQRRTFTSDTCEASGQGLGYAHIELYLIADGDNGYVGGRSETIEVSRRPVGAVDTAPPANAQ